MVAAMNITDRNRRSRTVELAAVGAVMISVLSGYGGGSAGASRPGDDVASISGPNASTESAEPSATRFPRRSASPAGPVVASTVVNPTSASRMASARHVPPVRARTFAHARLVFQPMSICPASSARTWAS
jgi:hypothetical protein